MTLCCPENGLWMLRQGTASPIRLVIATRDIMKVRRYVLLSHCRTAGELTYGRELVLASLRPDPLVGEFGAAIDLVMTPLTRSRGRARGGKPILMTSGKMFATLACLDPPGTSTADDLRVDWRC